MEIPPHARRRRATAMPPPAARTATTTTGATQPGRPPPLLGWSVSAAEVVGDGATGSVVEATSVLADGVGPAPVGLAEVVGRAPALDEAVALPLAVTRGVGLTLSDAGCVVVLCGCFFLVGFWDDLV
ncbi:hypothetical protein, partial [Nocardioides sp.]|uniref:hypothetical protein n=1 Tax=Nocardioides sp. TaxID=35761 RepID=UPI002C0D4517